MIRLGRFAQFATLLLVFPALARAHPGHDGHELTWDFDHLAAHPLATLGCFAVVGAGVCLAWRIAVWGRLVKPVVVPRDQPDRGR